MTFLSYRPKSAGYAIFRGRYYRFAGLYLLDIVVTVRRVIVRVVVVDDCGNFILMFFEKYSVVWSVYEALEFAKINHFFTTIYIFGGLWQRHRLTHTSSSA